MKKSRITPSQSQASKNNPEIINRLAEVNTWADQVDNAFNQVALGLTDLIARIGFAFPYLRNYRDEWKNLNDVSRPSY